MAPIFIWGNSFAVMLYAGYSSSENMYFVRNIYTTIFNMHHLEWPKFAFNFDFPKVTFTIPPFDIMRIKSLLNLKNLYVDTVFSIALLKPLISWATVVAYLESFAVKVQSKV